MIKYLKFIQEITLKKVMHFGAGNIGRGFFGQLYHESGYHIIFVDIVKQVIDTINQQRQYPIWLVGEDVKKLVVTNISGIPLNDEQSIIEASKHVNLISVSVGANNIKNLMPLLAKIIEKKFVADPSDFLNIIIGENMKNASGIVKQWILEQLSNEAKDFFNRNVGLVETVLSRMVPVVPEELKKQYPLIVLVEPYKTMPVAKNMFKGHIPEIKNFLFVEDIEPYEAMKLYIHNFTHASFACAGHLKHYQFIWESVSDLKIKQAVDRAYLEIQQAINKKYGVSIEELDNYYRDLIERFLNKSLGDTISRVAREPLRKLGPHDRFIGAAKMCVEQNVIPEYVCFFTACCLYYDQPSDKESQQLQNLLNTKGIDYVLQEVSGLSCSDSIFNMIKDRYVNFCELREKMI